MTERVKRPQDWPAAERLHATLHQQAIGRTTDRPVGDFQNGACLHGIHIPLCDRVFQCGQHQHINIERQKFIVRQLVGFGLLADRGVTINHAPELTGSVLVPPNQRRVEAVRGMDGAP